MGNSEKNKWENAMEIEKKNMGSMGLNMLRDNMDQTQKHTDTEVAGICTFVKDEEEEEEMEIASKEYSNYTGWKCWADFTQAGYGRINKTKPRMQKNENEEHKPSKLNFPQ